jgi:hypothetical protein
MEFPKTGNPHVDWWITILAGAFITIAVVARITSSFSSDLKTVKDKLTIIGHDAKEAKHQVKNDHSSNLRDDVDKITATISEIRDRLDLLQKEQAVQGERQVEMKESFDRTFREHEEFRRDIGGMRGEIRHERERLDNVIISKDR